MPFGPLLLPPSTGRAAMRGQDARSSSPACVSSRVGDMPPFGEEEGTCVDGHAPSSCLAACLRRPHLSRVWIRPGVAVTARLPRGREAVAQRVWRGRVSHKWRVKPLRMGHRR